MPESKYLVALQQQPFNAARAAHGRKVSRSTYGQMPEPIRGLALRLLVVVRPALVMVALAVPASASAQSSSNQCTGDVSTTGDSREATIRVDCGSARITKVELHTSDQGFDPA
jgi:hypothetical protein